MSEKNDKCDPHAGGGGHSSLGYDNPNERKYR